MLRDTNNGYTVSVDPYGRIVAEMATDVRGELDAPYDFRSDRTLYSLWGDWIAWLSLIASILILARAITMKRALSKASDPPAVRTKSKERHRRR
jgi:apolipoprotein N-acyltransferase